MYHVFTSMIGFVTWPHKGGQVTKPIILVKTCHKTIVFHSSSLKHLSVIGDFLASPDIKAFGHTYVGRAASYWPRTFFTPRMFLFSTYIHIYRW